MFLVLLLDEADPEVKSVGRNPIDSPIILFVSSLNEDQAMGGYRVEETRVCSSNDGLEVASMKHNIKVASGPKDRRLRRAESYPTDIPLPLKSPLNP